jgi:hypothetical protein
MSWRKYSEFWKTRQGLSGFPKAAKKSPKTRKNSPSRKPADPGPKLTTVDGRRMTWVAILDPLLAVNKFLFCLVLHNYKGSGSFYWCKLFLLIQACILMLRSSPGMVTNCCTAQNKLPRHNYLFCPNLPEIMSSLLSNPAMPYIHYMLKVMNSAQQDISVLSSL